ncbi:hypothetical protein PB1_06832 [Bacillus methanolicus PB1]|uniref:Uncharacterized protein n=1 Tax=Bacillus methanolicus PB1 TaxID=997296 RepID=I3E0N3_BACMT|nr:hypothetical protein PB1_06832 [Bacillus methanolicus PB1]
MHFDGDFIIKKEPFFGWKVEITPDFWRYTRFKFYFSEGYEPLFHFMSPYFDI